MASVDGTSETLARILYATFLIMGVILLVNMLIALLSNTYQKTADNSIEEWSFKRAVTIHTYDGYDPIPVPLNIVYRISITLLRLCKKDNSDLRNRKYINDKEKGRVQNPMLDVIVSILANKYVEKHGDIFPVTDDIGMKVNDLQMKVNDLQVTVHSMLLKEIEEGREMSSQILKTTFQSQSGDQGNLCTGGHMAWHCHPGIRIEGPLLTCELMGGFSIVGARYRNHFSPEFPHFEVIIIETGKRKWLGIGTVNEGYATTRMPGWDKESVGYHIDVGKIFHNQEHSDRKTEGRKARRGDRIRCVFMFEEKKERDGKVQVPVCFTLNGKKMIFQGGESRFYMDCDNPLFPFIGMTEGGSVLAKMCAKEDDEHHSPQLQEIKADLTDVGPLETGTLKENSPELQEIKADLIDVGNHVMCAREDVVRQSLDIQDMKSDLAAVRGDFEDIKKATRCLEEKLDALMATLGEKK